MNPAVGIIFAAYFAIVAGMIALHYREIRR